MSVSHVEIGTEDAAGTAGFLRELMGWTFRPTGDAGEGWFEADGLTVGLHGGERGGCVPYFAVDDLDAALKRMESLGGRREGVLVEEEGFGRFALCVDPQGNRFGLHQRRAAGRRPARGAGDAG